MTKEEILTSNGCFVESSGYMITGMIPSIYKSMEEYSNQQAIDFADWIFKSDILKSNHPIDAGKYFYNKSGELAANNTKELYSLFLK